MSENRTIPITALADGVPDGGWLLPAIGYDSDAEIWRPYKISLSTLNSAAIADFISTQHIPNTPPTTVAGNLAFFAGTDGLQLNSTPDFIDSNPGKAALYSQLANPANGYTTVNNLIQFSLGPPIPGSLQFGADAVGVQQTIVGTLAGAVDDTGIQLNAIAGYAESNSPGQSPVGIAGYAWTNIDGGNFFGSTFTGQNLRTVIAGGGHNFNFGTAAEFNLNLWRFGSSDPVITAGAYGIWVQGLGNVVGPIGTGVGVGTASAPSLTNAKWNQAFESRPGAAVVGLRIGPTESVGNSLASQSLVFNSKNSGGLTLTASMFADLNGALYLNPSAGSNLIITNGATAQIVAFSVAGVVINNAAGVLSTTTTPNLGIPSAIDLTHASNVPLGAIVNMATGAANFLSSPTSANLATLISNETGSGQLVFNQSPNIITPTGIVKGDVGLGNVDNTSDANKPISTATQTALDLKASIAYADSLVVGLIDDRGNYDASGNTFPTTGGSGTAGAILKGDIWVISVAGTLGGVAVSVGDQVRALTNTPGQTAANWAVSEGNIGYTPIRGPASVTDDLPAIFDGTSGALIKSKSYSAFKTLLALVKADVALGNVDNTTDSVKSVASAAILTTARTIDGVSFNGSANITTLAEATHAAASKATPIDTDELPLVDTAAANVLKKLTWANLKATLKAYLDTLYAPIASPTFTGIVSTPAVSITNGITANWAVDMTNSTPITLASGASANIATGSGYLYIFDANTGHLANITIGGGTTTIVSQDASEFQVTSTPTSSQTGVIYNGSTNYIIKNGFAVSHSYFVYGIRMSTAN